LSLRFVYGGPSNSENNDILRSYVVSRINGDESVYADCGSLGVMDGDKIIGAVLFHNWSEEYSIVELSAAADRADWLSRKTLKEIFGICFDQLGVNQTFARHSVDNKIVERIFRFLGGKQIILPNMRGRGKDESLMLLTADEWLKFKIKGESHGLS